MFIVRRVAQECAQARRIISVSYTHLDVYKRQYKARRDKLTIIASACYNPGTNCFCDSMGVSPTDPESADVIMREVTGGYVWDVKTEKGEAVTKQIEDLLEEQAVSYTHLSG